jgi:methyl-accepting chemotaxis protein
MALMEPAFEDAGIAAEPAMPVLAAASPGAPQDMRTAIGLFGAAILDQVETSVQTVLQENQTMREAAEEMASGALEAQGQFKNALQRTSAAEAGIGALNSVSGELAGSIRVIVVALRETATTVKNATAQAAETRLCVTAMANLSGAVASTVELIDNIARQTRMLSINASIEAARAGQAGLGFAVVADEVRGLSTQTAAATETIGGKIAELNAMVTKSVESLNQLASIIETVDASNGEIAAAIAGQEKLTVQVAGSAKDMQEAIFSLAKEVREGAQLASNSGSLAEMVLETANSVDGLMNALKANLNEIGIGMDSQSRDQDETASDRAPSPIITTPKQTAWA